MKDTVPHTFSPRAIATLYRLLYTASAILLYNVDRCIALYGISNMMILKNEFEEQGALLFRWRVDSFVPLTILPLVIISIVQSPSFADGHADGYSRIYDLFCILLSFCGLALRGFTVSTTAPRTSGRNTREQRAETLNTTGIYSVVRNPLYLANYIVFLGMLLFVKEWWLVLSASLAYLLYYERIVMTEEAFLLKKFGAVYADWSAYTPAMIPNFRLWKKPLYPFSVRTLLRREYNGFFLIIASFYLLEWCDRLLFFKDASGPLTISQAPGLYWTLFFSVGTVVFIVLRTLKKHTDLLDDSSRR